MLPKIINFCKENFVYTDNNINSSLYNTEKKFNKYNNLSLFSEELNLKENIINIKNNYIQKHKFCVLKNSSKNISILNKIKSYLKIGFKKSIENLKHNNNFNLFFIDNVHIFIHIMKYNILIELINKIIENNSCWELNNYIDTIESILYFNDKLKEKNFFYGFEILYLLQLPYIFKKSQLDKYIEIRNELINKNKILKLHQFMMGKGKTSVFTPLLSLCITFVNKKQATVITAPHLVNDTKQYLYFSEYFTGKKVNIFSDYDAKLRWIQNYDIKDKDFYNKINFQNEYNIIDEFDSHYNYLNSMFNLIKDNYSSISKEIFNYIFEFVYNSIKNIKNTVEELSDYPFLLDNIKFYYEVSKKNIYKKDYGFSFLYFEDEKNDINRLCSPFSRKDTPIKGSNYSSILYTLILTFKTYIINYDCKLTEELCDFKNIFNIIKYLKDIGDIRINEFINIYIDEDFNNDIIDIFKNIIEEIYKENNIIKNKKILLTYLYNINCDIINYAKTQLNISFQDLIYNNNNQWQVGYTGTTYLELFDYGNIKDYVFNNKIIYDHEEKLDILFAIYGYGKPENINKNQIFHINIIDNCSKFIKYHTNNGIISYKEYKELIKNNSLGLSRYDIDKCIKKYDIKIQDFKLNNNKCKKFINYYTQNGKVSNNNYNKLTKNNSLNMSIYEINKCIGNHYIEKENIYINQILEIIKDNPRGFIDLHGLFINYENNDIAHLLYNKLNGKYNIIFLDKDHNKFQLKNNKIESFQGSNDKNFYYYDQCHTIGTDLEQPQEGHIAILINNSTKMSDFAQAIFRFRKLNKGTYLSIIMINESKKDINKYNNVDDIYKLLKDNQNKFNIDQKDGIKLQILKAIVRKNSEYYEETDLNPEFMRNKLIDIKKIIKNNIFNKYLKLEKNVKNGINNKNSNNNQIDKYINIVFSNVSKENDKNLVKKLYSNLMSIDINKLKNLIMGTGTEITLNLEQKQEQKQEEEQQQNKEIFKEILQFMDKLYDPSWIKKINIIKFLNCDICRNYNCIELFKTKDIRINNKKIYISYNFRLDPSKKFNYTEHLGYYSAVYIEFNDMILIESYIVAILYYINKLPIYIFENGKIINPILLNNLTENKFKLNIDPIFVKIFGLKQYLNTSYENNTINNIKINEAIDDINPYSLYLIQAMIYKKIIKNFNNYFLSKNDVKKKELFAVNFFIKIKKYYYLSEYLKDKFKQIDIFNYNFNSNFNTNKIYKLNRNVKINNHHNEDNNIDISNINFNVNLPLQEYNINLFNLNNIKTGNLPRLKSIYEEYYLDLNN
jgi:hypothetical protein